MKGCFGFLDGVLILTAADRAVIFLESVSGFRKSVTVLAVGPHLSLS